MIEALIRFLIVVAVLVGCVFLVLWVFGALGLMIPHMVVTVIWVVVLLLCLLFLVRFLRPYVGNYLP